MNDKTIGHRELMRALSMRSGKSLKSIEEVFNLYTDMVAAYLSEGKNVTIRDIGTLKVLDTPAKVGRDINTGERIDIPPTKRVKLNPCAALKSAVMKR